MADNLLLDDQLIDEDASPPELASLGNRFVNFLIDMLIIRLVLPFSLGMALVFLGDETILNALGEIGYLGDLVFGLTVGIGYFVLFEYYGNGKTLGKLLTKTRAVSMSNEPMKFSQVVGRSFLRFVPFEPFSFFGDEPVGWHDQWSKTRVIKDK